MHSKISKTKRFAARIIGVALALSVALPASAAALTQAQVNAIISLLQSFGADASTVASVNGSLHGQAPSGLPVAVGGIVFSGEFGVGARGIDVVALQTYLEGKGFLTMPPGIAKGTFGAVTRKALQAYQKSLGISQTGYLGPKTRAAIAAGN